MQAAIAARAQAATAWERARLNQTAEAARQALVGELHAAARDSAAVDQASQALLRNVVAQADRANTSWFDAVKVSLDLPPSLLARGDGRGMAGKATVGLASLRQHGGTCTAYGAGVRYEGGTELQLARSWQERLSKIPTAPMGSPEPQPSSSAQSQGVGGANDARVAERIETFERREGETFV